MSISNISVDSINLNFLDISGIDNYIVYFPVQTLAVIITKLFIHFYSNLKQYEIVTFSSENYYYYRINNQEKNRFYFCPCAHLGKFESLLLQLRNGNCTHFQDVEPIFFQICYNIIILLSRRGDIKYSHCFFFYLIGFPIEVSICFRSVICKYTKRKYLVICSNCKNYLPQTECLLVPELIASVALYHFVVIDN